MRTSTYELIAIVLLALVTGCTEDLNEPEVVVEPVSRLGAGVDNVLPDTLGITECAAPKVLICHNPLGNPDNAHAICVGESAVAPHVAMHQDTIGSCSATRVEEPMCQPFGTQCSVDGDCCSGACNAGECIHRI